MMRPKSCPDTNLRRRPPGAQPRRPATLPAAARAPKKTGVVAKSVSRPAHAANEHAQASRGEIELKLAAAEARVQELEARLANVTDRIAWITDRLQSLLEK